MYTTNQNLNVTSQSTTYLSKVSAWMFAGLAVTAGTALWFDKTIGFSQAFADNSMLLFGLIILELVLVFGLGAFYQKLSGTVAAGIFFVYSALNGVTLSGIMEVYTSESLISTFFIASAAFGALGALGFFIKKDLSPWGSALFFALIGLLVALVVGFFLDSSTLQILISVAGVLIFSGFTVYDFNRIKLEAASSINHESKAVVDALSLYLDFINLFLFLLRLMGNTNN